MVGILSALHAEDSVENNTRAFSVLIAFTGGVWCELPCNKLGHIATERLDGNSTLRTTLVCA